jgi:RNA polymerase sigma-70 factor (ECF subfamily)
LDSYDPARPFLAWLRVIALNKCRDFGRRQAVRRLVLGTFASENAGEHSTDAHDKAVGEEAVQAERLA